jgi:hypothetical protein
MASILTARMGKTVLGLCLVAAPTAAAYVYPISDESVREAYFFGRSTQGEKVTNFLGQYLRRFPLANKGPSVVEMEFRTPYEQVVLRSSEHSVGYSAQQAHKDYAAEPDLVVVRLFLTLGPTPSGLVVPRSYDKGRVVDPREDFWRGFQFRVVQQRSVEPKNVKGRPLYSRRGKGLGGAEVLLEFDATQFAPSIVRVEVTTPDGQTIAAQFDLDKLK